MTDTEATVVEDLTGLQWRDDVFLGSGPLNQHTVMDYFSRSPFYSPNCNNEECKRQGLGTDKLQYGIFYHLEQYETPVSS